jgi:hypothetical protein
VQHRLEHPAVLRKAGNAIDDLDGAARSVAQPRDEHGRVAQVCLLGGDLAIEFDAPGSARIGRCCGAAQQRTERRVAVDPRVATPDHVAARIDQRRDAAVADQREVE